MTRVIKRNENGYPLNEDGSINYFIANLEKEEMQKQLEGPYKIPVRSDKRSSKKKQKVRNKPFGK